MWLERVAVLQRSSMLNLSDHGKLGKEHWRWLHWELLFADCHIYRSAVTRAETRVALQQKCGEERLWVYWKSCILPLRLFTFRALRADAAL